MKVCRRATFDHPIHGVYTYTCWTWEICHPLFKPICPCQTRLRTIVMGRSANNINVTCSNMFESLERKKRIGLPYANIHTTSLNSQFVGLMVGFSVSPQMLDTAKDHWRSLPSPIADPRLEMELMLLTRWANIALATNFDSSELLGANTMGTGKPLLRGRNLPVTLRVVECTCQDSRGWWSGFVPLGPSWHRHQPAPELHPGR